MASCHLFLTYLIFFLSKKPTILLYNKMRVPLPRRQLSDKVKAFGSDICYIVSTQVGSK